MTHVEHVGICMCLWIFFFIKNYLDWKLMKIFNFITVRNNSLRLGIKDFSFFLVGFPYTFCLGKWLHYSYFRCEWIFLIKNIIIFDTCQILLYLYAHEPYFFFTIMRSLYILHVQVQIQKCISIWTVFIYITRCIYMYVCII